MRLKFVEMTKAEFLLLVSEKYPNGKNDNNGRHLVITNGGIEVAFYSIMMQAGWCI